MKKLFTTVCTLSLSLLFLFSACTKTPVSPPDSSGSRPGEPEESLWDTSQTDLSHIRSERLIAFTFDDGPKAETEDLLDVFEDFNEDNPDWQAHATLFTLGGNIDGRESTLTRACDLGMELGNHSFSHPNLTTLSDDMLLDEINRTDQLLEEIDGKDRHLLRPPGGHYDDRVLSLVQAPCINWTGNLDTQDWTETSEENTIYNIVSSNLIDGGIVLMHQGYKRTVEAVRRLLPALKQLGFQVVSVSELAKAYGIDIYAGQAYSYLG